MSKIKLTFLSLLILVSPTSSYGLSFDFNNQIPGDISVRVSRVAGDISVRVSNVVGNHTICVPSGSSEEQIEEYAAAAIAIYVINLEND